MPAEETVDRVILSLGTARSRPSRSPESALRAPGGSAHLPPSTRACPPDPQTGGPPRAALLARSSAVKPVRNRSISESSRASGSACRRKPSSMRSQAPAVHDPRGPPNRSSLHRPLDPFAVCHEVMLPLDVRPGLGSSSPLRRGLPAPAWNEGERPPDLRRAVAGEEDPSSFNASERSIDVVAIVPTWRGRAWRGLEPNGISTVGDPSMPRRRAREAAFERA